MREQGTLQALMLPGTAFADAKYYTENGMQAKRVKSESATTGFESLKATKTREKMNLSMKELVDKACDGKIIKKEEMRKGSIEWRMYVKYMKAMG